MSNFGTRNSGFFGGASGGGGGVGTLQQVTDLGASSTNSLNLTGSNGIYVDNINSLYSLGSGRINLGGSGFAMDFSSGTTNFEMGQYSNTGNGTAIKIIDDSAIIVFRTNINGAGFVNNNGVYCDFLANNHYFGDLYNNFIQCDGFGGATYMTSQNIMQLQCGTLQQTFDAASQVLGTLNSAVPMGIKLDFNIRKYSLGDYAFANQQTYLYVDDINSEISFRSTLGKYHFFNVLTYATNAAALLGGLTSGQIYKNAAGVLSIVL